MSGTVTVEEIAGELRQMLDVSRGNPGLAGRLAAGSLTILYEFRVGEGEPAPRVVTVSGDRRAVEDGTIPYDDADIVIRTEPLTLHRLLSGDLGGREAVVSGMLDIRKAPSMGKLLLMRSLFNRYKKARRRGELPDAAPCDRLDRLVPGDRPPATRAVIAATGPGAADPDPPAPSILPTKGAPAAFVAARGGADNAEPLEPRTHAVEAHVEMTARPTPQRD